MNKVNNIEHPMFFEPSHAGKTLREVGVDYLKVESQNITSRWFHGTHDVDLFLWIDESGQIIKQQVSFCGQIVEWNILDGLKTGVVIEEEIQKKENDENEPSSSETIRFDNRPQFEAVKMAVEVIENIEAIEELLRSHMLSNMGKKVAFSHASIKPASSAWQRFIQLFRRKLR